MRAISVPLGIAAPAFLRVSYDPGLGLWPLMLVTAVSLSVTRRDGTTASWACTIVGASQQKIAFTHAFAAGDCPSPGRYALAPFFTFPGSGVPVEVNAFELYVMRSTFLEPLGYQP